jgi:hypothetical protein
MLSPYQWAILHALESCDNRMGTVRDIFEKIQGYPGNIAALRAVIEHMVRRGLLRYAQRDASAMNSWQLTACESLSFHRHKQLLEFLFMAYDGDIKAGVKDLGITTALDGGR